MYEQELAKRFGVSKSPVREALLRLREQKLVEVRARSGYRVRPLSLIEVDEMYEMRQLYERACVERAIEKASTEQLSSLDRFLTDKAYVPTPEWLALNRQFRSALAELSGNSYLAEASTKLHDHFDRFTIISVTRLQQSVDFTYFNQEHAKIVEAMKRRDKRSALSILRGHISASRERTLQALSNPGVVP
jgi:DNA-binding GntR family transcriptional regulator